MKAKQMTVNLPAPDAGGRRQQPALNTCGESHQTMSGGPQFNAVKHGLRSASVLLPGDDVTAYRALRREWFHLYQPCTPDEAGCVESIVGYQWRIAHCQRLQAAFRAALHAITLGGPAGHICEPDPHRWQHRAADCCLEEQRLHKLLVSDRKTLFDLQWMRSNRLIDGALIAPSYLQFLGEDEPAEAEEVAETIAAEGAESGAEGVSEALPSSPECAPEAAAARPEVSQGSPSTPSSDGQNGEFVKRTPLAWTSEEGAMNWIRKRAVPMARTSPPRVGPPARSNSPGAAHRG